MGKNMHRSTKIGWYFLLAVAVYLALGYIMPLLPFDTGSANFGYIFGQLSIFIPVLVYVICTKGQAIRDIHFKKIKIENVLIVVIFSWLCMPIAGFLNVISMFFAENHVVATVGSLTDNPFIVNVLMIAVVPAILEEIAYRGITFYGLRKYGVVAAAVVSGALFGLNHMNINQFLYAALLGIALALMDEASDSILASMIMHFVFNINTVLLIQMYKILPYLEKVTGQEIKGLEEQTTDTVTSLSDYPLKTKLILLAVYGVLAMVAVIINYNIYKWYAKRNGRLEHIKESFKNAMSGFRKTDDGRIISIPMLLGIFVCISLMLIELL